MDTKNTSSIDSRISEKAAPLGSPRQNYKELDPRGYSRKAVDVLICYISGLNKSDRIGSLMSPAQIVFGGRDSKIKYRLESQTYRTTNRVLAEGVVLDKQSYLLYKYTAIKYGNRYIKDPRFED